MSEHDRWTMDDAREYYHEKLLDEIDRLRAALKFVSTDPCFKHLGSVTHDTVAEALQQHPHDAVNQSEGQQDNQAGD